MDKAWSDQWVPAAKTLIGPYLLRNSTFEEDVHYAADLAMLKTKCGYVAMRVRRYGYNVSFANQFTIRLVRDSGAKTEMRKILEGWGDWFFYAHEYYGRLWPWYLIDLQALRCQLAIDGFAALTGKAPHICFQKKSNGDGTHFLAFKITSFYPEPPLLIAKSQILPPDFTQ
jgi:hypothetical protein